jgi:hypothetical protein
MGLKAQKQFVPLSFVNHDGGFYVALKPKGKGSLFFAPLECLESFRNTGHHAESGVSTADIKHRIEKSFGMSTGPHRFYDVELSFEFKDGEYAPAYDPEVVMRKNWHHGQHFTTRANGECIMRFRASLNSDLLHWILGMADNVTIRKPEKLKLMYRSLLDQMVAKSRN